MKTGGIFGNAAMSGFDGGGVFGRKPVSGLGCSCGVADVVPDDFGTNLITQAVLDEAAQADIDNALAVAKENAENGIVDSKGALAMSGTTIAIILGGVAVAAWMLAKPKLKPNRHYTKSAKRRIRKASAPYRTLESDIRDLEAAGDDASWLRDIQARKRSAAAKRAAATRKHNAKKKARRASAAWKPVRKSSR